MATKLVVGVVIVVAIALGAYFLLGGSSETLVEDLKTAKESIISGQSDVGASVPVPRATGSIDDFSAALEAELQATDAAMGALDADVDASVSSVQESGSSGNLYDPNSI